jgi:hypothetical protein
VKHWFRHHKIFCFSMIVRVSSFLLIVKKNIDMVEVIFVHLATVGQCSTHAFGVCDICSV